MGILSGSLQVEGADEDMFEEIKSFILESALMPILESTLRGGVLLELAKESDLFNNYLDIIE